MATEIRNKVNKLITDGELDEGIDYLKDYLKDKSGNYRDLYQQVCALDGEYAEWRKKAAMGMEPSSAVANRIRFETLQLADRIIEDETNSITIKKNSTGSISKWWLIGGAIVLIAGLAWFFVPNTQSFQYDSSIPIPREQQQYLYDYLGETSWKTSDNWGIVTFAANGRNAVYQGGILEIVNVNNNKFTGNYKINGQYAGGIEIEIAPNDQIFFRKGGINDAELPLLGNIWHKINN